MAAYQRLVMWLKVLFSVFTLASLLLSEEHLLLALFCKPLTCRLPSTRRDCGRGKSKGRGLPGGMAAYLATCLSEHMAVLRSKKLPRGACKGTRLDATPEGSEKHIREASNHRDAACSVQFLLLQFSSLVPMLQRSPCH